MDWRPHVKTTVHGVFGTFLVDTGAAITLLSKRYTDQLWMTTNPAGASITTIDGSTLPDYGVTQVSFDVFGAHPVLVVLNMTFGGILQRATIEMDQGLLVLDRQTYRMTNEAIKYRDSILG